MQLPVTSPNDLESDIPYYTWVNNQGANPAIAYNWVEISGTGTVVAQGDDVSTLAPFGFPFSFHGQTYTSAWVASNGYVGFGGAGSLSWLENMPLPAPTYPNNVIYGFWSYLTPTGGSNGNVYVQRTDATTFVIEWHQVDVWWDGQNVTFEIILNGADNSILLQYHTIGNSDTATVGIENETGTLATQYAYDTPGAIFDGLAIKFSPTHGAEHTIRGTVRDYDGAPVAGADVWATSGQVTAYARTDSTGAYALSVIPGTHFVRAEKSGLFTTPERTVTVPPDQAGVDLTFPRRYTLSGIVRDFDDTGLSSLQVSLSGGAIRTFTWTSQNGSYAFSVPAGTYEVKVSKYDGEFDPSAQTVTVPPDRTDVNFTFPGRYTISGTVRDNAGALIYDAHVTACAGYVCRQGVDTDQSGTYTLTVLAGTYAVRATKSGYPNTPDRLVTVPPSQEGVDLTFPPWYTVRGTVQHNDGTPVSDATVSTLEGGTPAVKTGADGTYTLTVAAGSYRVRVDKVGYPDYPYLPARQVTVPPSQTGVDFAFSTFYTVSGTVREHDGTPVEGVEVGTLWYSDPVYIYEYTDAQGQYVLGLPLGSYSVRADRTGYVNPPAQRVTVPPSLRGMDITFVQHFTVTGTVRDHDDAAVPFASVESTTQAETDSAGQYALHLPTGLHSVSVVKSDWPAPAPQAVLVPPQQTGVDFNFPQRFTISGIVYEHNGTPASGVRVRATVGPTAASMTTGADGRYSLTVAPGAYTLVVEQDGRVIPATRAITAPPDQNGVDFYLPVTYPLAGIVRDVHGAPLSGARVCTSGASGACMSTGSDGRYRFLIPAGRWAIYAYVSGGTSSYGRSWDVPPARSDVDFALPWDPRTYTISGSVRDSAGSPLGRIAVRTDTCYGQSATTALDGRFTFSGVPVGIHLVRTGTERRLAVVPPNATGTDFTYPVMYTITGVARDAVGVPLADARVQASVDGQDSASAYTDANGRYILSVLPGSYQIRATLSGYAAPLPRPVVVPPSLANVDFDFPAGYRIIGIVRDNAGQPIGNASVRVMGAAGEASTYTLPSGAYSLIMAAGAYTVTVSRSGYDAPPVQVVSLPPERLWLNFVLQSSVSADVRVTISGQVRDHDGSPVVGATVTAIGASGSATVNTDDSGAYRIRVPPGAYRVSVVKASLPPPPEQIVAVPPDQTNVSFAFPVRHIVRGVVRTSDGQPLASAGVSAEPLVCGQSTVYTSTDMSGAYTLTLAAGSYDVSASSGRFAATTRQRLTVPSTDSMDFTVRFPSPQYTVRGTVREDAGTPLAGFLVSAGACGLPGASTTTAVNGAYTLTLPTGVFNLATGFWTGSAYQQPSRSLTVAGDMTGVDFAVGTGCCAAYGYVTDESGKPVANAMVTAGTGYAASTNDCGGYRLPLNRPGTYTVSVSKAGYSATFSSITLPPNRKDLDFRLSRLSGSDSPISVLVRDATGQPLPLAQVQIVTNPGGASAWSGYADGQGRIAALVPPGNYRITASRTCYMGPSQSISVPPAVTTEVTLHRLASRISGRVTDSSGAAVYGARVTATGAAGTVSATTDSNGDYTLKISSGVWDISAQSASDCPSALATGRQVTVPPEQTEVNLVLLPGLPHTYLPLVIRGR